MTTDLFIVRHAEAIPRGSLEPDDNRWLTPRGRRRFYEAARRFAGKLGKGRVDAILTSPLPRAVMTAELLARALRLRGPVEVCPELSAASPDEAALALLSRQDRVVAAVGHEPMLSQLIEALTGRPLQEQGYDGLKKGAIAWLRRSKLRTIIEPS